MDTDRPTLEELQQLLIGRFSTSQIQFAVQIVEDWEAEGSISAVALIGRLYLCLCGDGPRNG